MKPSILAAAGAACVSLICCCATYAGVANFGFHVVQPIGSQLGNDGTEVWGVSPDGAFALGSAVANVGNPAFTWSGGVTTVLPYMPGGTFSTAYHATSGASILVGSGNSIGGNFGWRLVGSVTESIGDLPGGSNSSQALGISRDGSTITGSSSSALGIQTFRWRNGVMHGLPDLPGGPVESRGSGISADGEIIVGHSYFSSSGRQAVRWVGDEIEPLGILPGGNTSFATAITPDGTTVVGASHSSIGYQAVKWSDGVMTALGLLDGEFTYASAVSADGSVVVGRASSGGQSEAIIWDAEHGMRSLASVLQGDFGLNLRGLVLTEATGISDDGRVIVGRGIGLTGNSRGWIAVIPTPGTATVLGTIALTIGHRRRRSNPPT